MTNDDEERRQRSEAARQAAMRERIERQKERDRQIAIDIANVDKKATNRVVFESSDDDDDEESGSEEKNTETKKSKTSKKAKLFDSDDEENGSDEGEGKEELVIENRHSGAKGEKLMQMESRFNSDPRFKMDEKFVETDSEDDENDNEADQEKESRQEKEKNRELLSKVLGKPIREEKKTKKPVDVLMARPFTRYDPENPEHVEWMRAFEESKQKKTTKKAEAEVMEEKDSDDEEDEGTKEQNKEKKKDSEDGNEDEEEEFQKSEMFAHLDDKFSNELKEITANGGSRQNGNGGGFSFLEMMGRKRNDEKQQGEEEEQPSFNIDSSTSKPSVSSNGSALLKSEVPTLLKSGVRTKRFFIDSNDEQVRSLAANFRRTQDLQKVIDHWTPYRDAIFKTWKKQRRDVMKVEKEKYTYGEKKRKRTTNDEDDVL